MEIREIMTRDVEVVTADESLKGAAVKMRPHDVGLIPVCDGDKLKGVLTDRDITIRATAEGLDPANTKVIDVTSPEIAWASTVLAVRALGALEYSESNGNVQRQIVNAIDTVAKQLGNTRDVRRNCSIQR
jgi:CBS domain-containing protein